jgi:uncharacterized protein (TIGR00369 family)
VNDTSLGPVLVTAGYEREQLVNRMGIKIVEMTLDRVVGTMPATGNRQPLGILHGGANAVLAETLGSLAAHLEAGPTGRAVGLELSCTHHRWTSSAVTGVCVPLHVGGRVASYEITITDETGRRTCTARLTCAIARTSRDGAADASMADVPTIDGCADE